MVTAAGCWCVQAWLPLYRALCSAYIGRSMAPYIGVGSMTDRTSSAQRKAVAGSEGRLVQEVCEPVPDGLLPLGRAARGSCSAHQHVS